MSLVSVEGFHQNLHLMDPWSYGPFVEASMQSIKSEAFLWQSYRTCLEGQDHQQRSRLYAAVLDALPNPSSAIDSLPLFEVS